MKDEYVMMESIFNENKDVYLEEKVFNFNTLKNSIFKKMGFENFPDDEVKWKEFKNDINNTDALSKLSNFITEKTRAKNQEELDGWIAEKQKKFNFNIEKTALTSLTSLATWVSKNLDLFKNLIFTKPISETYNNEKGVINEMTANGIAMTIPISYVIFVLMMIFMEGVIEKFKKKK